MLEWSPKRSHNLEEVIMNSRILIALPLAAVLAFPAFAQNYFSGSESAFRDPTDFVNLNR